MKYSNNEREHLLNTNNNIEELNRFKCILQDYQQEYNALNYSFKQLNQYKIPIRANNINNTQQNLIHLTAKIKESLANSNVKLQQMTNDKIGLDALQSRLSQC